MGKVRAAWQAVNDAPWVMRIGLAVIGILTAAAGFVFGLGVDWSRVNGRIEGNSQRIEQNYQGISHNCQNIEELKDKSNDSSERLARIEEGVDWIKQTLKDK